jgi:ribonuclease Z
MSKIKIDILGTTAGVPTRERAHTAIHMSYDDGKEFCLLFDCGEGTQRQLIAADISMMKINDVFITHWHGDHCLGLPGMTDSMGFEGRKRPLAVYAPEARRVRKCLGFTHSMSNFKIIVHKVPARGRRLTELMSTERFSIVSTPVRHGVPAVAYALVEKDKTSIDLRKAISLGLPEKGQVYSKLKEEGKVFLGGREITLKDISMTKKGKKIVYSGDTEICDNLRNLARDADLLIQDCTYFEDLGPDKPHQHAALSEVIKMASNEQVKRTILTHISRKYQETGKLKDLVKERPGFEIADDFLTITV